MLQMYSKVVNVWILLGFLGSGFLPYSNSSRSMALDNLLLPNLFSVQRRKNKRTDKETETLLLKWWVKSMKKHLCRHERQTVVFSHVKNKKQQKTENCRCWNPKNTNALISSVAAREMKPFKIKHTSENDDLFLFEYLSLVDSCFCLLSTTSKLALVN